MTEDPQGSPAHRARIILGAGNAAPVSAGAGVPVKLNLSGAQLVTNGLRQKQAHRGPSFLGLLGPDS